jgi:hypothetical protein
MNVQGMNGAHATHADDGNFDRFRHKISAGRDDSTSIAEPFSVSLTVDRECEKNISRHAAELTVSGIDGEWPSIEPENTKPGITVTAADWAGLHGLRSPQAGGFALQIFSPVDKRRACKPTPRVGLGVNR